MMDITIWFLLGVYGVPAVIAFIVASMFLSALSMSRSFTGGDLFFALLLAVCWPFVAVIFIYWKIQAAIRK